MLHDDQPRFIYLLVFAFLASIVSPEPSLAQPSRITGKVNARQWAPLSGNVHPKARSEYDQGSADPAMEMNSVTLILKPSTEQQAELEQLLADQQNPGSKSYHQWITPEEYANRFGASQSDIEKIVDWAAKAQLTVTGIARARNAVMVNGTVARISSAFHTEIHLYKVNGETHYANANEPSVPAAIHNLVQAIHGLHDFRLKPKARKLEALKTAADGVSPDYTSSTSGNHYLAPDDVATLFNVTPLYSAGINGSGQKIVVVGQSQIDSSHLSTFASYFGLSPVNLITKLVPNTRDPGVSQSDEQESDLDLQWAAAVARGASLVFVYAYDVTDAVQYSIDQNLAPILSMSYGECEALDTQADAMTMRTWAQQGNAQGITWVTASGDSGAAGCYESSSGPFGGANSDLSLAADLPGSIPEVTSVGGTTLTEGNGSYWNSTNDSTTKASVRSYIPETAWNDSANDGSPAASGGGASQFFAKPSWQTGAGVPSDGARDVPDVAFPASPNHDGYMVYTTSGRQTTWYIFGGTSCGAPVFSGMLALLNQFVVSRGYQSTAGLGNVNPKLYSFAASTPGAFHDVTSGDNKVTASSCRGPRCSGATATSQGYTAGAGYDQVTGLGSLDAYQFVTASYAGLASSKSAPTIALTANPSRIVATGRTTLTATVTGNDTATPTGTVTFSAGSTNLGSAALSGSSGTATATLTVSGNAAGLSISANTITATYSGDGAYDASTTTMTLTVTDPASAGSSPSITGLTNSASYANPYAPGMVMSIFGSSLASTTQSAATVPLPTSLDTVSVNINGVAAPIYYISPTQLNVQIPYETPSSGTVPVIVNNAGYTGTASIRMAAAAPGIFVDANSALLPASVGRRGETIAMYVSGAGALEPSVVTGSTPGSGSTPVPTGTTLVTVGGLEASITYIGVPSWAVGILQVNFTVPLDVPLGSQPVVVSVGGQASTAALLTVTE